MEDLANDMQMLAPELDISADLDRGVAVMADDGLLRQVLHNLSSNAVKYNVPGGWIRLALRREPSSILLTVANATEEISEAEAGQIFERFFRGELARRRHIEGSGLGLSLSREIVLAHGGELTAAVQGEGAVAFRLRLPLPASSVSPLSE